MSYSVHVYIDSLEAPLPFKKCVISEEGFIKFAMLVVENGFYDEPNKTLYPPHRISKITWEEIM